MRARKGFNLLELMIAVIIIGVLAGIALPNYLGIKEKTRGAEARNTLMLIYRGYKTLLAENRSLGSDLTPASSDNAKWNTIMMDNPNESARAWFSYWVYDNDNSDNGNDAQLLNAAYARRRIGSAPFAAYTTTVDNTKFLRIDLNTGVITSSSEY